MFIGRPHRRTAAGCSPCIPPSDRRGVNVLRAGSSLLAAGLMILAAPVAQGDNWPQWRGPHGNGISDETGIPIRWDRKHNVAWRLPLPGPAGATPVVWADRIFLTSPDGDDLLLLAVSTEGKLLWKRRVSRGNRTVRGDEGNAASPSPCTDGRHVWATFANGAMACFDMDGREVYRLDLNRKYGPFRIQFGMTSTPVLYDGRLYYQFIHGDGRAETHEALVVCLDAATGREIWKSPRVTGATNENEHSYASPILYTDGERALIITHGADYTIAYDAEDGSEQWRLGGLNPRDDPRRRYHPTLRFVASPVVNGEFLVIPTAKNGPVFCIRPNGSGDLTGRKEILWWVRDANTPDVPSPLVLDELVYLCRENGNLLCLEARTGREVYHERTHRNRHRASPVAADGHVYLTARDGKVTVVKAGRTFRIVAQNDIGEDVSASPVIS
ncbi:MAG: pyrrolo-quinoline quinone, partial [Planctomycetota bacterium]